jgi:folate-binding protein YgfZ
MIPLLYAALPHRGVLQVDGEDALTFLQGLISNDVRRVAPDRALWAAFLTAQGKFLHEFFCLQPGAAFLLEGERNRLGDLKRRLSIYRLRSRVTLSECGDALSVWVAFGDGAAAAFGLPADDPGAATPLASGVAFVDPRLPEAGVRVVCAPGDAPGEFASRGCQPADIDSYDRLRIRLGLPDGSRDLQVEKSLLLECGFDELHGVDWQKGCYLGQELTARMRYRGLTRKRLMPALVDGPLPPAGTPILMGDRDVGEVRSGIDGVALAMVRLDALEEAQAGDPAALSAGDARLTPQKPDWATF